jgi:hypothetical protein
LKKFGSEEFPLDYPSKTCDFLPRLHNFEFGYENWHVHTHVHPLHSKFYLKFLEV